MPRPAALFPGPASILLKLSPTLLLPLLSIDYLLLPLFKLLQRGRLLPNFLSALLQVLRLIEVLQQLDLRL